MNVTVNGKPEKVDAGVTVADLVRLVAPRYAGRGIAVAIDGQVVAKTRWDETELRPDQSVEVLTAIGGG